MPLPTIGDPVGSSPIRVREVLHGKKPGDPVQILVDFAESAQSQNEKKLSDTLYDVSQILYPPYPPDVMYQAYNNDSDLSAPIDDIVDAVVGAGVKIVPASTSDIFGESTADDVADDAEEDGDEEQRNRLKQFLQTPNGNPGEDFSTIVGDFLRDKIVTGFGFLEFDRDRTPEEYIRYMWYAPSVVTRLSRNPDVYYQIHGQYLKPFIKLGAKGKVAVVQQTKASYKDEEPIRLDRVLGFVDREKDVRSTRYVQKWYDAGNRSPSADDIRDLANIAPAEDEDEDVQLAVGNTRAETLHEMLFDKFRDPLTTHYGRPKHISALGEHLLVRAITTYNTGFFSNNTVPPLAVVVTGGELGDDSMQDIVSSIARHGGKEEAHKTLVIEVEPGVNVAFEKLESERMNEGAFLKLRDDTGERMFAVLRVPITRVYATKVTSDKALQESNRTYLSSVIQPMQRQLENLFNRIFREHMGITDWRIRFRPQEAESLDAKSQIWERLLTKGVLNINEVRQELGKKNIESGDLNFINIPGTGTVIIANLPEFAKRALEGKSRSDIQPSGGAQTPQKGTNPVLKPSGDAEQTLGEIEQTLAEMDIGSFVRIPGTSAFFVPAGGDDGNPD